ncbi:hypothetical protein PQ469_19665 [Mucilaginibacter sp. KACC 22773]|uniref:hypothetical protein n=1 Tax=Mucilaginibacter sp. KACC 22773 TaxID=3025671 RepID=UPI0023673EFE|nr:hypothetical protein [Mucilaginibacter sp. KACC 22773]WDF76111.1 hypothetical protein PQ469_19665 [Mucilaginibacter sp. KACC 22773]
MKLKLIVLLSILTTLHCSAANNMLGIDTTKHSATSLKKPAYPLPPKSPEEARRMFKPWYSDCTFTNRYSVQKRLQKYPFSKAAKILAISYHSLEVPSPKKNDSLAPGFMSPKNILLRGGFKIRADTLDLSTILECKTLSKPQISELTNIIFNTNFKHTGNNITGGASCYEPRNAFVFINKKGEIYDYLEICFACQHYSSKSDKLDVGAECTQKYELLRRYFKSLNIRFGIKKGMTWNDDQSFKLKAAPPSSIHHPVQRG